jgi:hypothetical protein
MLNLYYFNHDIINPIILIICTLYNDEDITLLEDNTEFIFNSLIEAKIAQDDNILMFHIIKEHTNNTINLLLPSINCNMKVLEELENNDNLQEMIINETISNINCMTLLTLDNEELKIKDCDINLNTIIS